mmetsp:Transcript_6499/g.16618  ORF Transcript_6499/g.16618 Transcript_6499/m.16618 type:complete len:223 (+) Transcript_6499:381-1049(+)
MKQQLPPRHPPLRLERRRRGLCPDAFSQAPKPRLLLAGIPRRVPAPHHVRLLRAGPRRAPPLGVACSPRHVDAQRQRPGVPPQLREFFAHRRHCPSGLFRDFPHHFLQLLCAPRGHLGHRECRCEVALVVQALGEVLLGVGGAVEHLQRPLALHDGLLHHGAGLVHGAGALRVGVPDLPGRLRQVVLQLLVSRVHRRERLGLLAAAPLPRAAPHCSTPHFCP